MATCDLSPQVASVVAGGAAAKRHHLDATPDTCFWGYLDRSQPPVLEVDPGDEVAVRTVTHHAGDAPDLLMDDGIRALWAAIPEARRGPGVHLMTGPIAVRGAAPGDVVAVTVVEMRPRLRHGSNCAAHWGLLHDERGKERITVYELADPGPGAGTDGGLTGFGPVARPVFAYDFTTRPVYDLPGVVTDPDPAARQPFSRPVEVPVRPHLGVCGVAPPEPGRHSSIPPGVFGGNVDNWRLGPGATMLYPVFAEGALMYVGDPHFAQGDGEICGTAIEASVDAVIRLDLVDDLSVGAPVLRAGDLLCTHGFDPDLDLAVRMAATQLLDHLEGSFGLSRDDAYSLASVAADLGVTQVVDATLGGHALLDLGVLV